MRLPRTLPSLVIFSLFIFGQQVVREKDFTLTAHAELVLLDVSVKDVKGGGYISDLKKKTFRFMKMASCKPSHSSAAKIHPLPPAW